MWQNIIEFFIGGAFATLLMFFVNRHDQRKDKKDEILARLSAIEKRIDILAAKGDEREAVAARVRILRFGDELLEKKRHSKDSFDQCLSDITNYDHYCDLHPEFKNHQTATTVEVIKKVYEDCLVTGDFL